MTDKTIGNDVVVRYIVKGTRNTAEDLWWYCKCDKHNKYYVNQFLTKEEQDEYYQ